MTALVAPDPISLDRPLTMIQLAKNFSERGFDLERREENDHGGAGFWVKWDLDAVKLSVQFGKYNYCSNRVSHFDYTPNFSHDELWYRAGDAEIAVLVYGNLVRPDDTWEDTVKGWVSVSDIYDLALDIDSRIEYYKTLRETNDDIVEGEIVDAPLILIEGS